MARDSGTIAKVSGIATSPVVNFTGSDRRMRRHGSRACYRNASYSQLIFRHHDKHLPRYFRLSHALQHKYEARKGPVIGGSGCGRMRSLCRHEGQSVSRSLLCRPCRYSMNADRRRIYVQREITWVVNDRPRIVFVVSGTSVG